MEWMEGERVSFCPLERLFPFSFSFSFSFFWCGFFEGRERVLPAYALAAERAVSEGARGGGGAAGENGGGG